MFYYGNNCGGGGFGYGGYGYGLPVAAPIMACKYCRCVIYNPITMEGDHSSSCPRSSSYALAQLLLNRNFQSSNTPSFEPHSLLVRQRHLRQVNLILQNID
jgi:hypothetical protein